MQSSHGDDYGTKYSLCEEMHKMQKKIVSGIRPSGRIHLGNYLGAIKHGRELGCQFFIADLHGEGDVTLTKKQLYRLGVEAEVESWHQGSILLIQHYISKHVGVGRLERMTQYKDKSETEQATLKLLSYPVLMAADIFHFEATHIPVGADQVQHIEFVRDVADILNHHGGKVIKPEAVLSETPRIMSLSDGTKKMSKSSDDEVGCIYIDDAPDVIRSKVMNAKTAMNIHDDTPEMKNLNTIYRALGGGQLHTRFKDFKEEIAQLIIDELAV